MRAWRWFGAGAGVLAVSGCLVVLLSLLLPSLAASAQTGFCPSSYWNDVATPSPGNDTNSFFGVAGVAASDVWAVGAYQTLSSGVSYPLVAHWNGVAWSAVSSPTFGGTAVLHATTAISADDVWAVGEYISNSTFTGATVTEHWDGSTWTVIPSPSVGPVEENPLVSVSAVSSTDVWAAGYSYNGNFQAVMEHWNGTAWSLVHVPNPTTDVQLFGVAAISSSDAWAVGWDDNGVLIIHWDGSTWSLASGVNTPGRLQSVTAASATNVWAVGYSYNSQTQPKRTLTEHWDGSSWQVVPSPNLGSGDNVLAGVTALSPTSVWAVGQQTDPVTSLTGLIEHWDGSSWTIDAGPRAIAAPFWYTAVATVAPGRMWTVGADDAPPSTFQHTMAAYYPGRITGPLTTTRQRSPRSAVLCS